MQTRYRRNETKRTNGTEFEMAFDAPVRRKGGAKETREDEDYIEEHKEDPSGGRESVEEEDD